MRGKKGWQPIRLKEARLARGFSQASIAAKIERSPATVSKWENEDQAQSPDEVTFLKLCQVLKVPPAYLVKEQSNPNEQAYFFRELGSNWKSVAEREKIRMRWLQEISLAAQTYVDLPEVNLTDAWASNEFKNWDDEDIESAATEVRNIWHLKQGPIADVILAMENAGIVVGYDVIGSSKMDGLFNQCLNDQRPYVLIAEDKYSGVRSRADVAHELGHAVLHRNLDPQCQKKHHKEIEKQAWRFAAAFLMPAETFSSDVNSITLNGLLALKPRWKISVAMMIMRCFDLGIIDQDNKSRLFRNINVRRWRKSEPLDDELGIERPRLLRRSIELIVESGTRSKEDFLEQDVALSATDVEQLANLKIGFFNTQPMDLADVSLKLDSSADNIIAFPPKISDD